MDPAGPAPTPEALGGGAAAQPPSPAPAAGAPTGEPALPPGAPPPPADDDAEVPATNRRVLELLASASASFGTLTHAPTRTSQESADVRGVALASGAKAMLLKLGKPRPDGGAYVLAVLSAARQADLKALKGLLGVSRLSMASVDDVRAVTGCVPGAVPPFGSLFAGAGVLTAVDTSLVEQGPDINFNAGLRTFSVTRLAVDEYLRIEKPALVGSFSSAAAATTTTAGGAT